MQFGVCIPHYGRAVSVDDLRAVAEGAEDLGYHSLWVSDHVVTPSHLMSSIGPTFYDAFVVLSYAAAFTKRVKLGSSVIVVPYRNPLVTAKMLATLDVLSGGRVIFGVGAGGAPDEFQALGVPSHLRGRLTDEYLRLMLALWTQDPTSFRGRFFSFDDVRFEPKPVQKPHPPIWVGGRSDAALRRAVAVGEAWHPTAMRPPALQERMDQLRHLAQEAGRSDGGPVVTVHQSIRLSDERSPVSGPGYRDGERRLGQGTPQQIREDMAYYREIGVPVVVCNFASANTEELLRAMDTFANQVMPYFSESA
jgi:probable F420-dependent oxidoreductase